MDMAKPKIRFKGYTDEWEQRKLGDVIDDMYNGQTPSRNKSEYWNGTIKWLSSGELNRGTVYDSIETITEEGQKAANLKIVPKGTFVMAITGLEAAGTRGNCALLGFDTTLNQSCMALFPKQEMLTSEFLFQWYRKVGEEYGINYTQGTKQQSYNAELIKILPISLPSVVEQRKISSYLSQLDHLITLHQRKCEQAKKLKKYMLQKMFPQNGQKVPEIRFKGFTDDWEQRKLNEVTVKIGSGKTPSGGKSAYVDTGIPLIRSQNVNDDKVDFNDIVYIDELTDESMANSRVFTNDVLLNITGASIGRSAVYKGLDQANVNQHVCIVRPTDGYCPDFVQLNLASDSGQKQIESSQAGGGREGLNFQQIGKMHFSFPTLDEQKQIGGYFNALDNLITLHQQKCDELKNIKKFMLQNMFI